MNRRRAGTTLIEILVVIVVFAVGILAVIQIFPRGFQILVQTRNRTVATQLARAEIERIKARPDQLPEQIVAVYRTGGGAVVDTERSSGDLGPTGDSLSVAGILTRGGSNVGVWSENSGANVFRRIIGEGQRVPAPAWVGNLYGGLMVLQFGPVATETAETVYGGDLLRRNGAPNEQARREPNEYFVANARTRNVSIFLPAGPTERRFRLAFTAYVEDGTNFRVQRVVGAAPVTGTVPAGTRDMYGNYPLYEIPLADLVPNFFGAEFDSIRVARLYERIDPNTDFSDAYQYKVLDPSLGVLLFSAVPAEDRDPLTAKVDYDVKDWRILREEFRVPDGPNPQYRLALGNLKVGGQSGPDGRPNEAIFLEKTGSAFQAISDPRADHLVLQDLTTGGVLAERSPSDTTYVRVDKSSGVIRFDDSQPGTPGLQGELLVPGASAPVTVNLENRPLRALYMANQEWSVQLLKAASDYSPTYVRPGPGQYYVGGSSSLGGLRSRIYFPPADAGRRVSIDELLYRDANGNQRQLYGQDFQIAYNRTDVLNLPSIDITGVAGNGAVLSLINGYSARGVKGASIAVRVLHNPTSFSLTDNSTNNMRRLEEWGRNWRRSTTETFIQRGDNIR